MRVPRFSIAGLMGFVFIVSIGLVSLRWPTPVWAGAIFLMTWGVLSLAVVGAVCRGGPARAWWLGFALFGWGYLLLVFWNPFHYPWHEQPALAAIEALRPLFGVPPRFKGQIDTFIGLGQCLWTLVAAALGGMLGRGLFGASGPSPHTIEPRPVHRRWWSLSPRSAVAAWGAAVLLLLMAMRSAGWRWAALALVLVWGLIGLAAVGAACDQGRRRAAWLGSAVLGAGYMVLAFGSTGEPSNWPRLATDRLLLAVRDRFPQAPTELPSETQAREAANARIRNVLDRPLPMRFPEETPLEDVLKYVKEKTRDPHGSEIPIYVEPYALDEAFKTMSSPIAIDLEAVPLATSLRLALRQLGLGYSIIDGVLLIHLAEDQVRAEPRSPFLVIGQCLLGLVAAGLGALISQFVSDGA